MKIKITALALIIAASSAVNAQSGKKPHLNDAPVVLKRDPNNDGTKLHEDYLRSINPNRAAEREAYENMVQNFLRQYPDGKPNNQNRNNAVMTLPVVVHVVYKTTAQNISDAQVISQIDVLNEDFNRLNADTTLTPSYFRSVAANMGVQFCLATRDPNGNPTNGINRVSTTVTSFTTDDKIKSSTTGGATAWDPTKYLNIWVGNLGGGLLGYGEFPTGTVSQTFGSVIMYNAFGRTGNAAAPYNKGRTTTHEFSHCFNLFHTWGDDGTACSGTDYCNDTPNQAGSTLTCPTGIKTDNCGAGANGIQYQNYMDYTEDACLNMFTLNQKSRVLAVLNNAPYNALQTSNGCLPTVLPNNDAGISVVNAPTGSACEGSFVPKVTLKNFGANTLGTCTINYKVDAGTNNTFNWSGSLASLGTTVVTLPAVTAAAGAHTLTAFTSNPNGVTDANANNNQAVGSFTAVANVPGAALPYIQGFEGTFPPTGVTIVNPDAATTWAQSPGTTYHVGGTKSARMDNWNYNAWGEKDDMQLPSLNLSGGSGTPTLTFQVAYQLYTDPASVPPYSDTLDVIVSTDCGATWNNVYRKAGTNLTTTTPTFNATSTTGLLPTSSQWRQETVNLGAYANASNVIVRFRSINQYENFIYVDDINISSVVNIKEIMAKSEKVDLWPNPNNGNFSLNFNNIDPNQNVMVSVYNNIGELMIKPINAKGVSGVYNMDLSELAAGVYHIEIRTDNNVTVKKVIINK